MRSGRRLLAGVGLVAALAASACAVLIGVDGDYAAGDAADAATDAPYESGDAGPRLDAATGFCETLDAANVVLCADFDDGKPVSWGWESPYVGTGNSLALDLDASSSPPASAFFRSSPTSASVTMERGAATPASQWVVVEADFRMDRFPDAGGGAAIFGVNFTSDSGLSGRAAVTAFASQATLDESFWNPDGSFGGGTYTNFTQFPLLGQWMRIRLEVDLTQQTMATYFDGKLVDSHPLKRPWPVGAVARISLGFDGYTTSGNGWGGPAEMHADNAVLIAR